MNLLKLVLFSFLLSQSALADVWCEFTILDIEGNAFSVNINSSATVQNLKGKIFSLKNKERKYHPSRVRLIFSGKRLENDSTLESAGLQGGTNVHLVFVDENEVEEPKQQDPLANLTDYVHFIKQSLRERDEELRKYQASSLRKQREMSSYLKDLEDQIRQLKRILIAEKTASLAQSERLRIHLIEERRVREELSRFQQLDANLSYQLTAVSHDRDRLNKNMESEFAAKGLLEKKLGLSRASSQKHKKRAVFLEQKLVDFKEEQERKHRELMERFVLNKVRASAKNEKELKELAEEAPHLAKEFKAARIINNLMRMLQAQLHGEKMCSDLAEEIKAKTKKIKAMKKTFSRYKGLAGSLEDDDDTLDLIDAGAKEFVEAGKKALYRERCALLECKEKADKLYLPASRARNLFRSNLSSSEKCE